MVGLLLIYYIGKVFYGLAEKHNKNKMGFAVFGIASYYVGTFIAGIIFAIIDEFFGTNLLEGTNQIVLSLMALPIGLLSCWALYTILENNWTNVRPVCVPDEILDGDLIDRGTGEG